MEWIDAKTIYNLIHLLGVAIGAGGALMSDFFFMFMTKDKKLDTSEFKILKAGGYFVWVGLILLIVSGTLLFALNPDRYIDSSRFLLKMFIVVILTVNGFIFHIMHIPRLEKVVGENIARSKSFSMESRHMYASGAISIASWISVIILGGLRSIPYSLTTGMIIYFCLVGVAILVAEIERRRFLRG